MAKQLAAIACLGFAFLACENDEINPVIPGAGGSTAVLTVSGGAGMSQGGAPGTTNAKLPTTAGGNTAPGTTAAIGGAQPTNTTAPEILPGSCSLIPTEDTGWVAADTNTCGIQGAWYAYNDCAKSPDDCTRNQLPDLAAKKFPNVGGKLCTSGTTVPILKQYELKWGAGIGLNLNQPEESDLKNPIATLPVVLKGFSFTLSGTAIPSKLRVTFPTAATEETGHFKEYNDEQAGEVVVMFSDAAQGEWVTEPIDLVPGEINAIQFQVVGDDDVELPFDFCIENLKGIY